jgi:hypothetical protein
MYGGNASGVELRLSSLLDDPCYIDEREAELQQAREELRSRRVSTATGVVGAFRWRISYEADFADEVASVYANLAQRLGYLSLDGELSPSAWYPLTKGLRARCRARDWRVSEVQAAFGPPSLVMGQVYAYVKAGDDRAWVCFDFDRGSEKWPERDYLLREIRTPARTFARELTFTPYGRRVRESE